MLRKLLGVCGLVAILSAVGCGGSSGTAGKDPVQLLPGEWQGSMVVDRESVGATLSAAQIAELERMKMGISFNSNGASAGDMVISGVNNNTPYQSQGRWELLSKEGDTVTIKSIEADGSQKPVVIVFENENAFYMPLKTEVANIGAMKFERLR